MPYSSVSDLPAPVKAKIKSPKKRRQWLHVWNSEYDSHGDESRAFASAWSAVKKGQMMTENVDSFKLFLPIAKVDKERRQVSGYASTPALDMDGEIVSLDAVRKALPGYMAWRNIREMHTSSAVGVAKEANIDDKGLFLTAKIVDEDAWQKCLEGVYKGFSVGGRKLAKTGKTITEIDLVEISVVDRPANPECKFEVAKSAKSAPAETPAFLVKTPSFRDPRDKALGQMAKAVRTLSKAPVPGPAESIALDPVVEKREFSTSERKQDARSGAALPDGSYPIENRGDLENAIRAFGRGKNKSQVKAHIKSRAKTLGLTSLLPEKWGKKAKAEKKAKKLAKQQATQSAAVVTPNRQWPLAKDSALPPFLTLSADDGLRTVEGDDWSGHEPKVEQFSLQKGDTNMSLTKSDMKLLKRMDVAGSLSYCFDSIRNAQRSLMLEAKTEGGDMKDKALAQKLGGVAKELAAVIGQKAEHEGQEALDLSDADDQGYNFLSEDFAMVANTDTDDALTKALLDMVKAGREPSRAQHMDMARANMKKARKSRKEAEACIKAAHAMHKAAYLAKMEKAGGKKPDADGDFDHGAAMEKLQKAYGALKAASTFSKAAKTHMEKAAGRSGQKGQQPSDGNANYQVPAGVKNLSPTDLATAGPGGDSRGSEPYILGMTAAPNGKAAKGAYITTEHAEALARAAAAEAEASLLKAMPAGPVHGRRPASFDLTKLGLGGDSRDDASAMFKGVDVADLTSDDAERRGNALAKAIGNRIISGQGKSVFDPTFHGTAGGSA